MLTTFAILGISVVLVAVSGRVAHPTRTLETIEVSPGSRSEHRGVTQLSNGIRWRRRSSTTPTADEVAGWCDELGRRIRGGDSLSAALRYGAAPASVSRVLVEVRLAIERGAPVAVATERIFAISPDLDLVGAVVAACVSTGSAPAEPLDRTAAVLRSRHAAAAERTVHSAQARLSARVMTLIPVAMLALLLAVSADTRAVVMAPLGVSVLLLGGVMNLLGWLWADRIIRVVAR